MNPWPKRGKTVEAHKACIRPNMSLEPGLYKLRRRYNWKHTCPSNMFDKSYLYPHNTSNTATCILSQAHINLIESLQTTHEHLLPTRWPVHSTNLSGTLEACVEVFETIWSHTWEALWRCFRIVSTFSRVIHCYRVNLRKMFEYDSVSSYITHQ